MHLSNISICILAFIFLIAQAQTAYAAKPAISFISPTPLNNSVNTTGNVLINTLVTNAINGTSLLNWDNSLVGWWRMNEAAGGTLVRDFSGHGNNGTWHGNTTANIITGRFGAALRFDGVKDYVDVNNSASLNLSNSDFSISFWINGTAQSTAQIIQQYNNKNGNGWKIKISNTNIYFYGNWTGSAYSISTYVSGALDNQWHHLVLVRNQSSVQWFKDGVSSGNSDKTNINADLNSSISLNFGSYNGATEFFNNSIDEIRIHKRELNLDEIKSSYDAGLYRLNTTLQIKSNGTYNYLAYIQDSIGTLNQTETRYITTSLMDYCSPKDAAKDWNINSNINCSNVNIIRYGNTIISNGGSLTLNNVTLITYGNITGNLGSVFNLNHSTLKLISNNTVYNAYLNGESNINYSTITSWNATTNQPVLKIAYHDPYGDHEHTPRSSISSTGASAKLSISNSNLSYLGWSGTAGGVTITSGINLIIQNNTFINNYYGLFLDTTDYIIVENNTFQSTVFTGSLIRNSDFIQIKNNTIRDGDIGLNVLGSHDSIISNNTILNMTNNYDAYDVGIFVWGVSRNITIENNNLSDIGTTGILLLYNSTQINISNNSIDLMEINDKYSNTVSTDINEPETGISIVETYKGWTSDSTESYGDNLTKLTNYKNRNITLSDNTFGSNVQVLLYSEGTLNLTQDLTDYWEFNYSLPRLSDPSHFYISNSYDTLSSIIYPVNRTVFSDWWSNNLRIVSSQLSKRYTSGGSEVFFDYIVQKNSMTILPRGYYKKYDMSVVNASDIPYDFYLYSPAYTPFGVNKSSTIFSNGTLYINMYNDLIEPRGYHTINMTIVPSSGSVVVNVSKWNAIGDYYKKWNESSTNSSIATNHVIGDFPANNKIAIKKNGTLWNTYTSNSTGYIAFTYSEGFSEIQFETTLSESEYIPPSPTNLTETHGNFWVNHTWQSGAGNITNSYNVSVNGIWINGSSNTFLNNSAGAGNWSNITVWAFNNSGTGSLSSNYVSQNIQLPSIPDTGTNPSVPDTNTAPSITNVVNGSIGDTYGIVNFTVNQSNALTHILYSINSDLSNPSQTMNQSNGTDRSVNITDLNNGTRYYYSVYAFNSSNTSLWTYSIISYFTVNSVNKPPIFSLIPSNGSLFNQNDSIVISINASDPDNDSLIFSIKIDDLQVSTAPNYEWKTSNNSPGYHHINVSVSDGKETVTRTITIYLNNPRYDVDENGFLNTSDIVITAQHINEITVAPYPKYDVNMDGIVDILDITIIGHHFGEAT